eukprot:jgi/Botrbrau1/13599/Bobra.0307s0018.1
MLFDSGIAVRREVEKFLSRLTFSIYTYVFCGECGVLEKAILCFVSLLRTYKICALPTNMQSVVIWGPLHDRVLQLHSVCCTGLNK